MLTEFSRGGRGVDFRTEMNIIMSIGVLKLTECGMEPNAEGSMTAHKFFRGGVK